MSDSIFDRIICGENVSSCKVNTNSSPYIYIPPTDFRKQPEFPIHSEIASKHQPQIRANKVCGRYRDVVEYLDTQYNLYREDFLRPLRRGVLQLKSRFNEFSPKYQNSKVDHVRFFENVHPLDSVIIGSQLAFEVQFDPTKFQEVIWEFSKSLITGSLLCLSNDGFRTFIFATVCDRDCDSLRKGVVSLKFANGIKDARNMDLDEPYFMIESEAFFEAYRYVLLRMQQISTLPFAKHIVECSAAIEPPRYLLTEPFHSDKLVFLHRKSPLRSKRLYNFTEILRNDSKTITSNVSLVDILNYKQWPSREVLELNESQYDAARHALTKEFALIQGPPGTGKTYIGIKVANLLLHNPSVWNCFPSEQESHPMLLVCYTNHALDQFLEGILTVRKDTKIARLGGRSESAILEKFTLKNLRKDAYEREKKLKRKTHSERDRLAQELHFFSRRIREFNENTRESRERFISVRELRNVFDRYCNNKTAENISLIRHLIRLLGTLEDSSLSSWIGTEKIPAFVGDNLANSSQSTNSRMNTQKSSSVNFNIRTDAAFLTEQRIIDDPLLDFATDIDANRFAALDGDNSTKVDPRLKVIKTEFGLPSSQAEEYLQITDNYLESFSDFHGVYTQYSSLAIRSGCKNFREFDSLVDKIANFLDYDGFLPLAKFLKKHGFSRNIFANKTILAHLKAAGIKFIESGGHVLPSAFFKSFSVQKNRILEMSGFWKEIRRLSCAPKNNIKSIDKRFTSRKPLKTKDTNETVDLSKTSLFLDNLIDVLAEFLFENCYAEGNDEWCRVVTRNKNLYRRVFLSGKEQAKDGLVKAVKNLKAIKSDHQRILIYRRIAHEYRNCLRQLKLPLELQFEKVEKELREVYDKCDAEILVDREIIACTTTGAAKFHRIINEVDSRIIFIEEAAEVLESHIVSSITKSCEHLILIGDHKQLRPSPTDHYLAKDYHLEVSLFERMINNGLDVKTLSVQHRMRPEISRIIRHIYPMLRDHSSVETYENVRGIGKNIFFISHSNSQDIPTADHTNLSYSNRHEAEFCLCLAQYILNQGQFNSSQITILTPYSGQLRQMRNILETLSGDVQQILITAVDNYQGEENEVIILSLVRSKKDDQRIGFCAVENRVCVALSRAKKGFYCIGNFEQFCGKSELWAKICKDLEETDEFGVKLPLYCQNHPNYKKYAAAGVDFLKIAPLGGCITPCGYKRECGHKCESKCHPIDVEHIAEYRCKRNCEKSICDRGHKCPYKCYEDCVKQCRVPVQIDLPECGHTIELFCFAADDESAKICMAPCDKILKYCPFGHVCAELCSEKCSEKCERMHKETFLCGHTIEMECSKIAETCTFNQNGKLICMEKCNVQLICNHKCFGSCGECYSKRFHIPCDKPCERILLCGHSCPRKCSEICLPCDQKLNVKKCSHSNSSHPQKCGEFCILCVEENTRRGHRKPCDKKDILCINCDKTTDCVGVENESCPPYCQPCCIKLSGYGNKTSSSQPLLFIHLPDCNHVIEMNLLDELMNENAAPCLSPKTCPICSTPIMSCQRYIREISRTRKILADVRSIFAAPIRRERITLEIIKPLSKLEASSSDSWISAVKMKLESFAQNNIIYRAEFDTMRFIISSLNYFEERLCEISSSNTLSADVKNLCEKLKDLSIPQRGLDQLCSDIYREIERISMLGLLPNDSEKNIILSDSPNLTKNDRKKILKQARSFKKQAMEAIQQVNYTKDCWQMCESAHIFPLNDAVVDTDGSLFCPYCHPSNTFRWISISRVPEEVSDADIRQNFEAYGKIPRGQVRTVVSKGSCRCVIVEYEAHEAAVLAIEETHEKDFFKCGTPLKVKRATTVAEKKVDQISPFCVKMVENGMSDRINIKFLRKEFGKFGNILDIKRCAYVNENKQEFLIYFEQRLSAETAFKNMSGPQCEVDKNLSITLELDDSDKLGNITSSIIVPFSKKKQKHIYLYTTDE